MCPRNNRTFRAYRSFFVIMVASSAPFVTADVLYVDDDAALGGDGTTWNNAYRYLQDALTAANPDDEIRVAGGEYRPDQDESGLVTPGLRTAAFDLPTNVTIHGGYAGLADPDDPDHRDTAAFVTTLNGDLAGDDEVNFANRSDNSLHVIVVGADVVGCVLDGLTIRGGNADAFSPPNDSGGAIYIDGGAFTLNNVQVVDNQCLDGVGGAIAVESGDVTITNSSVSYNCVAVDLPSGGGGGGLAANLSTVVIEGSAFSDNVVSGDGRRGGAILCTDAIVTVDDTSFVANRTPGDSVSGGALALVDCTSLITDSSFDDNECWDRGAAIALNGGAAVLSGGTFSGNIATSTYGGGAGISAFNALLDVEDTTFLLETTVFGVGAGLDAFGGSTVSIDNCAFEECESIDAHGGAVALEASDAVVARSSFFANRAYRNGGALHCDAAEIINCTFFLNTVPDDAPLFDRGGGVYTTGETLIAGSMFCGNGGGAVRATGSTTIANSTLVANVSVGEAGAGVYATTDATITNSILWGNEDVSGVTEGAQVTGDDVTVDYCAVQGLTRTQLGVGNTGLDPLFLDPLGPDGDPNSIDDNNYRLAPGSPCIDSASNSAVPADLADLDGDLDALEAHPLDLDGLPRFRLDIDTPDSGSGTAPLVDMGAYEYQPPRCAGDANCDGVIDFRDINPFIDALMGGVYCDGTGANADMTADDPLLIDAADINPFVDILIWNATPVPCQ